MIRPNIAAIAPFFIVGNVDRTIAFYRDKLGFETTFQQPEREPFFAILVRYGAQIFVKSEKDLPPLPNSARHRFMRWDAFVSVPDPDALASEFAAHGAAFSAPLEDTHGLAPACPQRRGLQAISARLRRPSQDLVGAE
jgi:catechol 2,3-dioxygenase-like lactoylglutathione lyase family enzyme